MELNVSLAIYLGKHTESSTEVAVTAYDLITDYHKFGHYMSHALNALYFLENSSLHIDGRDW